MLEASHGLKENKLHVLINETQLLEMNSFSSIDFKYLNKKYM